MTKEPGSASGSAGGNEASLTAAMQRLESWPYAAVLLGVVGGFLIAVQPVLSPIVLYGLFLYLIWPLTGAVVGRRLAIALTALFALWVVHTSGLLLAPFIIAGILAYILDPAVDWFEAHGVSRSAGIALLALPLAGLLALVVLVLVPAVARQLTALISNIPEYVEVIEGWIRSARAWLIGLDITGLNDETVPALRDLDAESVAAYVERSRSEIAETGAKMVFGLGRGIGTVLTLAGYLVLTPLLTYYLLRDWDRIRHALIDLLPEQRQETVTSFAAEYDRLLSRYLRGQLLLALVVGLTVGVGFWAVDFPYALLLGIVAGVFNVVPYLGLVIGVAAASVVALFSGSVLAGLLKVAVVFGVEQVVEAVAGPYILSGSVGLHPVWVIFSLVVLSFFFGFVGLLVAVPLAVLIKLGLQGAYERYRGPEPPSSPFSRPGGPARR